MRALAVIVALGLFSIFSVRWMDHEQRVQQARLDVSRIAHAVRLFRADFGRCPADVGELVAPPDGSPYLPPLRDPWGRDYQLQCPSRHDGEDADVFSRGPDGAATSRDNVKNMIVDLTI